MVAPSRVYKLSALTQLVTEKLNLEAAISNNVDLDVDKRSVIFNELEGVARITVHIMVAVGGSAVREEDHDLMGRLGVLREIILSSMHE